MKKWNVRFDYANWEWVVGRIEYCVSTAPGFHDYNIGNLRKADKGNSTTAWLHTAAPDELGGYTRAVEYLEEFASDRAAEALDK